jgi:hypothetical protein
MSLRQNLTESCKKKDLRKQLKIFANTYDFEVSENNGKGKMIS